MMSPEEYREQYGAAPARARFEDAVRALRGPELAELIVALAPGAKADGVSGELMGICLEQAVARLQNEGGKS